MGLASSALRSGHGLLGTTFTRRRYVPLCLMGCGEGYADTLAHYVQCLCVRDWSSRATFCDERRMSARVARPFAARRGGGACGRCRRQSVGNVHFDITPRARSVAGRAPAQVWTIGFSRLRCSGRLRSPSAPPVGRARFIAAPRLAVARARRRITMRPPCRSATHYTHTHTHWMSPPSGST